MIMNIKNIFLLAFLFTSSLSTSSENNSLDPNKIQCKLISEEFVGSMVTLFLEDQNNHEFKVQMQEIFKLNVF